jgi:hypothetical protein
MIKHQISKYKSLLLITSLMLMLYPISVQAQKKTYSNSERTVLAFFKASKHDPDFEYLAENLARYRGLDEEAKQQFKDEEKIRLEWIFAHVQPDKDMLDIKTTMSGGLIAENGQNFLMLDIPGGKTEDPPFFPFNIANVWVAVLLDDIDRFLKIPLSENEYKKLHALMPSQDKTYNLKTSIAYRILRAEPQEPINMGKRKYWLMLGEVGHWSVSLADTAPDQTKILWDYYAPWYLNADEVDLIKMLNDRP